LSPGLWQVILEETPTADLIHINEFWGPTAVVAATACVLYGKPYIVSPRGRLETRSLEAKPWKKRVALSLGIRRLLRRAEVIHYTTEMERACSPDWVRSVQSVVVPNPIEVPSGELDLARAEQRGLREGPVLLGVFGRIHARKGFDILVPALAEAVQRVDLRLLVVGPDEGGYRSEVLRLLERANLGDRVVFAGALGGESLAQAYASVDLLLLPSHGESFGNVLVEAAAQGTPCITSDQVGLLQWVRDHEVGVVLPLDVNTWAVAIEGLDRRAIHARWRPDRLRQAAQVFSPRAVAAQMIAVYESMLAARTPMTNR
jgi:glycosyltransferase involved in cell wall biosynthesis